MLGHLGAMLGPCWAILGPSWAYVGPSRGHLGPRLGHLGPSWGHLGPMLGPSWGEKSVFVEEQKTAKNTANCGATHRSAAGAGSPIAKASGLRPGALPEYCWPDLSAYARQPARGPTMLAHLVARLAYVGLSCGQCGPSCGPMLRPMSADLEAYVGPC